MSWRALLLACALYGCGQRARTVEQSDGSRSVRGCSYTAEVVQARPLALEVSARCTGRNLTGFSAADEASRPFIRVLGSSALFSAHTWLFAAPQGEARIRYRVDLDGMAARAERFDSAQRFGESLVAPASSYLLAPEPLEVGVPIDLTLKLPPGVDFATGLTPIGAPSERRFALQAHEMSVATYSVFGRFKRGAVKLAGADVQIVTANGALDLPTAAVQRWVGHAARAVADFYGHFPAPNTLVLLLPVPEREGVVFGKVLPQSSPGIALLLGQHAREPALYQDWILVHELFHIGFPSFYNEAKWLDEGSATYFEPLIRARTGDLTELEVWTQFAHDMPRGLHAIEHEGLEHPSDFRAVYWGGAIACLLADVAGRRASHGALGLQDAFRAVLAAGGNASRVWSLAQVTAIIDRTLGAPILQDLIARHALTGSPVNLPQLFTQLGVSQSPNGSVTLDDHAELAAIRHAITYGTRQGEGD